MTVVELELGHDTCGCNHTPRTLSNCIHIRGHTVWNLRRPNCVKGREKVNLKNVSAKALVRDNRVKLNTRCINRRIGSTPEYVCSSVGVRGRFFALIIA